MPTRGDVRAHIPEACFERSTTRSLSYLFGSLTLVVALVGAATFIPMTWWWAPAWAAYAIATGTAATGLWVIAHECGHGAFSPNQRLQDGVGFVLHTALLVPYYSWQRSHSVHHAATNHLELGETHVPARVRRSPAEHPTAGDATGRRTRVRTLLVLLRSLLLGWPAYLLFGATGSPQRGPTNHFWPARPFRTDLFPPRWHQRVWLSAVAVIAVIGVLAAWAVAVGSIVPVALFYIGPYLVVNAWLVAYTWLQHTDVDVPHFEDHEWTWMLGAFQTVDRPYGHFIDLLHHRIGSTHVAHHIDHRIPHYHAAAATIAIQVAFPQWYRFDPTPVPSALWRVASECVAVQGTPGGWYFRLPTSAS